MTGMVILVNGCAGTRKNRSVIPYNETKKELLLKVKENNIGKNCFVIQKISVSYNLNGEKKRFNGNLKHNTNGDILISIRVSGGIEVARIYLDKDSVRINDRINKIYSYGPIDKLKEKYGFNYEDIYLLFGDIPELFSENDIELCESGISESKNRYYNSYSIRTRIDCKEKKIKEIIIRNNSGHIEYNIVYERIKSGENYKLAEKVSLNYPKIGLTAEIELKGFKLVSVTNMKFWPGTGYKYKVLK
ncbi:MAG: DUF4292 domain-containing protein [Bacteroidales bacterium]|nr:DUF4292 domain-containing protein [Bacteroidales bacterium]